MLETDSTGTCCPDAAARRVVPEDDRASHPGQLADRLTEPVVEPLSGRRSLVGLREHRDEQLEYLDANTASPRPRRSGRAHPGARANASTADSSARDVGPAGARGIR